jgi:hypothetical protein
MAYFVNGSCYALPLHSIDMSDSFPPWEVHFDGAVPTGYQLICPFCNEVVEGVHWDEGQYAYVCEESVDSFPVTITSTGCFHFRPFPFHPLVSEVVTDHTCARC